MKRSVFLGSLALAGVTAGPALAGTTLEEVLARGELNCGVHPGLVGFAAPNANDVWEGFDVDYCRAVAAAIFGDPSKVSFIPVATSGRYTGLSSGEVDLLSRITTWTFTSDVELEFEFVGVSYYDGQGFIVPTAFGVSSARELDGATICVQTGTTSEMNLIEFFRINNMSFRSLPITSTAEGQQQYLAGACDAYTTEISTLAATRATFEAPGDHIILPEVISKEPLGPLVRHGDPAWGDLVRWVHFALIAAEELGVTSANVSELAAAPSGNPEVNRLLGTEGGLGAMLGLSNDWAVKAILAAGNYGELFEKNIGQNTPIGLARGLNALWTEGGLLYAMPFR
ncbi:MAG: amino acid ABC transporter substrate-binding protein [Rubellimicrobium sp.]|nr:amino acid ABC transporter substrate-binding protein [Rubellimicrobium sp.]